ncbi:unnamed protein product [Haemonchus placei]|uniref:Transposase n=1 Tax=Haemonchus placei TaxID=6290 RepID=A0A158QK47_HAEPC|nr:unnamed protein product [Haemonchus placei]
MDRRPVSYYRNRHRFCMSRTHPNRLIQKLPYKEQKDWSTHAKVWARCDCETNDLGHALTAPFAHKGARVVVELLLLQMVRDRLPQPTGCRVEADRRARAISRQGRRQHAYEH